ncbi:c-type cytochrome [Hymenobacter sp. BT683]|uniref:C-type cytochrome n=1 Tax=Hymenobacter jeongseonensis TaxID=2791027 RepID=A0ABS0IGY8_9BACT|nr:c-type cytochrome [Hymenobacter jeongseonensis]
MKAVAQQPQIDTSVSKIGTEHPGGVAAVPTGATLLAASDCASCHKMNDKVIGPAYVAIAQKYPNTEANATMLAGKIIHGGSGNWGAVPMTPHAGISADDAQAMAKYILSLR